MNWSQEGSREKKPNEELEKPRWYPRCNASGIHCTAQSQHGTDQRDSEATKGRQQAQGAGRSNGETENPKSENGPRQAALAHTITASLHCGHALGQESPLRDLEFASATPAITGVTTRRFLRSGHRLCFQHELAFVLIGQTAPRASRYAGYRPQELRQGRMGLTGEAQSLMEHCLEGLGCNCCCCLVLVAKGE